ncbi:uncharacterized protein LAESUDRAFT_661349 [Laetiporus sulphureus 93-53]|uniref:ditrans,polycis-polyprenyl diphosphate synthase [(2E,6E)-farnesyldiphosphate specific] n=1 Tax=Laetiporus sulphureus 93-53 TaxID=1314785 RepID=A0A165CE37_9APHY|nr:uncharacterized protein LAESUDRAFT_661349 [Laetiporus sulphureus 93-53]KZT02646.1 hypothetical protein LAESUDRAFT_661349 [Laetiporus sulphureus 93-53]
MSWLASVVLAILHSVYWLVIRLQSLLTIKNDPEFLTAERKKVPKHLALLLVTDDAVDAEEAESLLAESVERAAAWCRKVGIARLTVYDREGILEKASLDIRERLQKHLDIYSVETNDEFELEFPLTPPSSEDSDSQPSTPDAEHSPFELNVRTLHVSDAVSKTHKKALGVKTTLRHRRSEHVGREPTVAPLTVHILSRQSGKPAISQVASALLHKRRTDLRESCPPAASDEFPMFTERDLNDILEGKEGFPSPELMIIYRISPRTARMPLELHGFPPWQIRLTEFYFDELPNKWRWWRPSESGASGAGQPLQETTFRRALDDFAAAEMRLGK